MARGAILENPCNIPGAASYQPKPKGKLASKDVIDRLIGESENPWKAFFAIVVYGGLRRGEVAELRISDLLWTDGPETRVAINVQRACKWTSNGSVEVGRPKSEASVRTVWLGRIPTLVLRDYLLARPTRPDALLFSQDEAGNFHFKESTIRNEVKKAGVKFGFTESLHRLRDFSLTLYAQQGATLQELMKRGGHSNVKAAMAYQRDAGRDAELAARMG